MEKYEALTILGIAAIVMVGLMFAEFTKTWEKIELSRAAVACAELPVVPQ